MIKRRMAGTLLALLIGIASIVPVAQAAGTMPSSRSASSPKQSPEPTYDINVVPEAQIRSDSIKMSLTIFINSGWGVRIGALTTQHYDFQLLDAGGKVLYKWSADRKFADFNGFWIIDASKPQKFSYTLSGGAYNSIKDKIATFRAFIIGEVDFIDPKGYEVDLRPDKQMRVTAKVDPGADSLKMSLSIYNGSRRDVNIGTCTSDFKLFDAKNKVLYSSASIYGAQRFVTVEAGKTYTFSETISGSAYQKIKPKIAYMKAFVKTGASCIDQKGYMVKFDPGEYVTITPNAKMYSTYMNMSLTIQNNSQQEISIEHLWSGMKYNFELLDAGGKSLYVLSANKSYAGTGPATTRIGPGKSVTWTETLSGDAYKAIKNRVASVSGFVVGTADFLDKSWYTIKLK